MSIKIEWTRPKLERFKHHYQAARARGLERDDVFTFQGNKYVMGYAKYLIEYLDKELPK